MSKTKAWWCVVGGIVFIAAGFYFGWFQGRHLSRVGMLFFSGTTFGAIAVLAAHKLHERPISTDAETSVVVRRSRIYPFLCLVSLGFLTAALVYGLVVIKPDDDFRHGLTGTELKLILLVILPFLLCGAWFYLLEFCRAQSSIILDRHGINDQRTPVKTVAWAEISNVALDGEVPKQSIVLTMRHPAQHPRPWWRRLLDSLRSKITPVPLRIHTAGMMGNPQWLFKEIRARARPRSDESWE